jgi:hypothetical protein
MCVVTRHVDVAYTARVVNFNRLAIDLRDFLGFRDRPKKKKRLSIKKKYVYYISTCVLHFFYSIYVYNLVFHSYLSHFLSIIFIFVDIKIYKFTEKIRKFKKILKGDRLVGHPWHIVYILVIIASYGKNRPNFVRQTI